MVADRDEWRKVRAGDEKARTRMIERHLGLVKRIAGSRRLLQDRETDDLISVGMIGLVRAVDRYDPDRGFAFGSFAGHFILGAMREYLRSTTWMTRNYLRQVKAGLKPAYEFYSLESLRELWEAPGPHGLPEPVEPSAGPEEVVVRRLFLLWVKEHLCREGAEGLMFWREETAGQVGAESAEALGITRSCWSWRKCALRRRLAESLAPLWRDE